MAAEDLAVIAEMLALRNRIDLRISQITGRPMASGHLGEWIASQVFDIELEPTAVAVAIDGRFRSGPLESRTVNVKWYLKREGLLDTNDADILDFYLVMTGPQAAAAASKGETRPWCIDNVYLIDAHRLPTHQVEHGLKRGVAASVRNSIWAESEVYPADNRLLMLDGEQRAALRRFHSSVI